MTGPLVDDHAVVVGISRYPRFVAEGVAEDLQGPDHDAEAVRDWLVDARGGRLPPENVTLIRSADCRADPAMPQPARHQVEQALEALEERTRTRSGRRLYLYFSGHGFAPDLEEAALYTAEASHRSPTHVYAHSWLRWFRKAQRFAESVLWVDACMNYQQSILAQEVTLREQVGKAVPGPAFIAVAAQTKSALERCMPDGKVHGVFTWTLLRGLEGGAADRRGRVTGRSLQDFLHNAMAESLPPEVRRAASVDLQPFVRADEGLDFLRLPGRPTYDVTLTVPAAQPGQRIRVWTGSPHRVVTEDLLSAGTWHGSLERGVYFVEVPEAGLRQGFQVTGTAAVEATVRTAGPPVRAPDGEDRFRIEVSPANPAASVVLVDHEFQRLYTATGSLDERELPGVYKLRTQFGRDMTTAAEQYVLLDRDLAITGDSLSPLLTSAAPLPGSASTDDMHTQLFEATAHRAASGTSSLSVMSRYWTDPEASPGQRRAHLPHPMDGLQLLTPDGTVLADLVHGGHLAQDDDPVAVWEKGLEPGGYALRQTLSRGVFEGTVVVSPGWVTQVVVRRATDLGGTFGFAPSRADGANGAESRPADGAVEPDDVAVFMRRPADAAVAERDDVVEAARLALTHGRDLFGDGRGGELRRVLLEEYEDPIAGIIGCHLLLRSVGGPSGGSPGPVLDRAVQRLRGLVVDPHPDVEALSLRCADPALRAREPFAVPPVFVDSWRLVVAASYADPSLVPAEVWARVHAATRIGSFFVWATDDDRREAHARQLEDWIAACQSEPWPPEPGPGAAVADLVPPPARMPAPARGGLPELVREAAQRRGIPAAAAAGLWGTRHAPVP